MQYTSHYTSPLGNILLAADETGLTGLWFEGQKYYAAGLPGFETGRLGPGGQNHSAADSHAGTPAARHCDGSLPVFASARQWLDIYFSGGEPAFKIPLHFIGTAFQKEVWDILYDIPYGRTMTYGEIAALLAKKKGIPHMSAQAVGGAVGRNKISIIVPCHRVVGADGSLTGYAGGIDKKLQLLKLEGG